MASKESENPTLNGFDILSNALTGSGEDRDDFPFKEPDEIELDEEVDDKSTEDIGVDNEDEDSEDIQDTDDSSVDNEDEDNEDDVSDKDDNVDKIDGDVEKEVASFMLERLGDELGIELDEDLEVNSVKDLVEYLKDVVDEASQPQYSSDEVKELDEYVKSGGKLEDFIQANAAVVDLENIDLSSESNQKRVLKEHLKTLGYNDERIKKAIDRYEDAGVLEDEAEDALELLKEHTSKLKEELLKQQKEYSKRVEKQQQEFVQNVEENIENLKEIKGVPVTRKEKKELLDYIFKTDSSGQTQFQKDFDVEALIEAAYFRKMGKDLVLKAKKQGSSDAYKKFHQKLKSSKKRQKQTKQTGEEQFDAMKRLGSLLVG